MVLSNVSCDEPDSDRRIPIIAITANPAPAERKRALDAGCDGYLAKPIDPRALPQQVRLLLG